MAGRQIDGEAVAFAPEGGNLQDRRSGEPPVGEKQIFHEAAVLAVQRDLERHPGQLGKGRPGLRIEGEHGGRHEQDAHLAPARQRPDAAREGEAVEPRHAHVENQQVGPRLRGPRETCEDGVARRELLAGETDRSEQFEDHATVHRLVVDHGLLGGKGVATIYNHASSYTVGVGDHVDEGQVLGYEGDTGWSTGCHLHFTVMADGVAVDPMPYF